MIAAIMRAFRAPTYPATPPESPQDRRSDPPPAPTPKNRATAPDAPLCRFPGLVQFIAPIGDDVKRYAPKGFPHAIWSKNDLDQYKGPKRSNGHGLRAGHVLLKDRRKPWQKAAQSVRFDRTGTMVTGWK